MTDAAVDPNQVTELDARGFDEALDDLAAILVDAVATGASVGFVRPLTLDEARAWWRSVAPDVGAGRVIVLILRAGGRAVGTAQLRLAQLPNGRHRAEVAKVLVHRDARRRGIGRMLMARIEATALRHGRTLLVLDTLTGSDAERLYEGLGWTRAAEIPRFAELPDGTLAATTIYFKVLR